MEVKNSSAMTIAGFLNREKKILLSLEARLFFFAPGVMILVLRVRTRNLQVHLLVHLLALLRFHHLHHRRRDMCQKTAQGLIYLMCGVVSHIGYMFFLLGFFAIRGEVEKQ